MQRHEALKELQDHIVIIASRDFVITAGVPALERPAGRGRCALERHAPRPPRDHGGARQPHRRGAWFSMPHQADDDEVWNGNYAQARYAQTQGLALGLSQNATEAGNHHHPQPDERCAM